jgi:uncharacterized protein (TIGR02145 family)
MKKSIVSFIVLFTIILSASGQVPLSFKYQTVLRDAAGVVISSQQVSLTLEILRGSGTGPVVCSETYECITNEFGLINLEVGSQDATAFEEIDWAVGPYFLRVSLNGNVLGTSELLSVPYALYAKNSGDGGLWMKVGNNIYYSEGSVGIGSGLIDNSALLDLTSTSKGFLPPRMTSEQMNAISNPADGLMIFCSDCGDEGGGAMVMHMYGVWYKFCTLCIGPNPPAESIHLGTQTSITWKWHPVSGASGYKWSITDDYSGATDLGTDTSYTQTNLLCGTEYRIYIWAYASACNSSSTELTMSTADCNYGTPCPGMPTVEYEGHTYNTVLIGSQCWLKENLDVGVRIDGTQDQINNGIIEKYCYDDDPGNCEIYGGLYKWEETMKYSTIEGSQGICPNGWHVPSDAEWCTLTTYIDEAVNCNIIGDTGNEACLKMKSSNGWFLGGNGTNETGFTSLPAGVHFPTHYQSIGLGIDFWTSTLQSNPGAYYWVNYYTNDFAGKYILDLDWNCAVSIRCLRNE